MSKQRSNYMAKADVLFAKMIRERDGSCRVCGSTEFLQCAHLISRSYKSIRVNPDNAVGLCRKHHLFYTMHPLEWRAWVDDTFGSNRWLRLAEIAGTYPKVNWKAEYESLRVTIEGAT